MIIVGGFLSKYGPDTRASQGGIRGPYLSLPQTLMYAQDDPEGYIMMSVDENNLSSLFGQHATMQGNNERNNTLVG